MRDEKLYYIYILASGKNGTLYIGVTSNLYQRIIEHKNGLHSGFTKKYDVNKLVYYETYQYVQDAILREKQMKKWKRDWKIKLIEKENPGWKDMYNELFE